VTCHYQACCASGRILLRHQKVVDVKSQVTYLVDCVLIEEQNIPQPVGTCTYETHGSLRCVRNLTAAWLTVFLNYLFVSVGYIRRCNGQSRGEYVTAGNRKSWLSSPSFGGRKNWLVDCWNDG
jgi:hypothetical protein